MGSGFTRLAYGRTGIAHRSGGGDEGRVTVVLRKRNNSNPAALRHRGRRSHRGASTLWLVGISGAELELWSWLWEKFPERSWNLWGSHCPPGVTQEREGERSIQTQHPFHWPKPTGNQWVKACCIPSRMSALGSVGQAEKGRDGVGAN